MTRRRILSVAVCGLVGASTPVLWWPLLVRAAESEQRAVRVGFVQPDTRRNVSAFWQRLRELGWVEGQNLVVERRGAGGELDRLPALMADVVRRNIDVLVTYSTPGGLAAKNATNTIPIVVATMGDPVGTGLVANLARPGRNLTGVSQAQVEGIGGKWLELLQETVPRAATVAVIGNPESTFVRNLLNELIAVAPTRHLNLMIIEVRKPEAIDSAFLRARHAQAVLIPADPLMVSNRARITELATKFRLPGLYGLPDFVESGGLMAYGPNTAIMFRRAADYVDKILKGANPGELPIEQPTQFELIVNLKAARTLGIVIPESILQRADEVIK